MTMTDSTMEPKPPAQPERKDGPAPVPHRRSQQEALSRIAGSLQDQTVPEAAPAADPESAPEAYTPEEDAPVTGERAEEPVTLTGEESDEQLQQMGFQHTKPATAERIRRLAREAKEAREEATRLREAALLRERDQAKDMVSQATSPKPAPVIDESEWKFNEKAWRDKHPEPDRDDYDAHARWEIRREAAEEAHEAAVAQNRRLVEAIAPQLAETRHAEAMRRYEAEWQGLANDLERYGTSRDELEKGVVTILQNQPGHSVKSASYIVMDYLGVLDGEATHPAPPSTTVPGKGRTMEPGVQPQKKAPTRSEREAFLASKARELAGAGGKSKSVERLAVDFLSGRIQRE